MMQTISWLYKLSALRQVFKNRGMLEGKLSDYAKAFVLGDLPVIIPMANKQILSANKKERMMIMAAQHLAISQLHR